MLNMQETKINGVFLGETGILRAYVGTQLVFVKGLFPAEKLYPAESLHPDPASYAE